MLQEFESRPTSCALHGPVVSKSKRRFLKWFMVHQPPYSLDAPIALKIGLVQLLVVLCDTHWSLGLMMIISPWNSRSHLETATRFGIRHMILLGKVCRVRRICVLLGCAKNYLDTLNFSDGAKNLGWLATGWARARKKMCFFSLEKIEFENFDFWKIKISKNHFFTEILIFSENPNFQNL